MPVTLDANQLQLNYNSFLLCGFRSLCYSPHTNKSKFGHRRQRVESISRLVKHGFKLNEFDIVRLESSDSIVVHCLTLLVYLSTLLVLIVVCPYSNSDTLLAVNH